MKTSSHPTQSTAPSPGALWLLCVLLVSSHALHATLPEPDNVLHGNIYIGTNRVTAVDDNVAVVARRLTGETVASYRMGATADYGDHYVLAIPVESAGTPINPLASLDGYELTILVLEYRSPFEANPTIHYQSNYLVGARGDVAQIDFGSPVEPMVTGYEAWEVAHALPPGSRFDDSDGDGTSNDDEYVAGTDPTDPDDKFKLTIQLLVPGFGVDVLWAARRAEGEGYEGKTRHYSLEQAADLTGNEWQGVPGYTNIVGNNQPVFFTGSETNTPSFFRGRVWLEP